MKVLLLHIPKFNNYYKPIGDFIWLNYMPMGLIALAEHLNTSGFDTEIVHLGVEWVVDNHFTVADLVRDRPEIRAVGITIHWHHQSYDAIRVAAALKAVRPDLFVFAGGDTASFYHREIVTKFTDIDAVVRGYAEEPARKLMEALKKGRSLVSVPNLTWRDETGVHEGELRYTGTPEILESLNYTAFHRIRNHGTYITDVGLPFFYAKRFNRKQNRRFFSIGSPVFPISIGRGCPFNCTWCGGSQVSQRNHVSGMKGFVYRPMENVLADITAAAKAGYGIMQSAMDPEPHSPDYFIDLWRHIRKEKLQTRWIFECNGLPTKTFVKEFARTFPDKDSVIALSPECGNETLRKRHKGPGFSTTALMKTLGLLQRYQVATEVFFTYGLPGENAAMLSETADLQKTIVRSFSQVRAIRTMSVELEPGSPWHLDPARFGIVTNRKTFRDFYEAHSDGRQNPFTSFGYYIPDYFETPLDPNDPFGDFAARMQAIKCRRFCFIHPNPKSCGKHPWQGRLFCSIASALITLKPANRSAPYEVVP